MNVALFIELMNNDNTDNNNNNNDNRHNSNDGDKATIIASQISFEQ